MITYGWSLDAPGAPRRVAVGIVGLLVGSLLISPAATLAASSYDPAADMNSMANTSAYLGATDWWSAGYTGKGVDVALIDTGVSPVDGLDGAGKVVDGPDLSLESQNPDLTHLDTNGHGTFMAGLIAAHGTSYTGMAPGARIVSVKVGVADGGVDVSQMIAAITWVIEHRTDNGLNIRVINLSYGTNSAQSSTVDPLAYAAEQAWKAGIVVVVAGGNNGFQNHNSNAPALSDPAIDRYVLAVGSTDSNGTATQADDSVPAFSPWPKRGSTRSVDLVAPGVHIQGLRVANAYIDITHPEGRIDDQFFRGSGTSESAAIVSGAAALVLDRYPNATPDQVKKLLTSTGYDINAKAQAIGGGELQLSSALKTPLPSALQAWPPAIGSGSLDAARGTDRLADDGVVLSGERDIFGAQYDASAMAVAIAAGNTWSGGTWNGNTWSGNTWSGNTWSGNTWSGNSWSGNSWSGMRWSGNTWSGMRWSGNTWSGNSWSGNSWSGGTWATASCD